MLLAFVFCSWTARQFVFAFRFQTITPNRNACRKIFSIARAIPKSPHYHFRTARGKTLRLRAFASRFGHTFDWFGNEYRFLFSNLKNVSAWGTDGTEWLVILIIRKIEICRGSDRFSTFIYSGKSHCWRMAWHKHEIWMTFINACLDVEC